AVARALVAAGAVGLLTTHDLALTGVADLVGGRARNVHFADRLVAGTVTFDYTMRPGVVPHGHALALLPPARIDLPPPCRPGRPSLPLTLPPPPGEPLPPPPPPPPPRRGAAASHRRPARLPRLPRGRPGRGGRAGPAPRGAGDRRRRPPELLPTPRPRRR